MKLAEFDPTSLQALKFSNLATMNSPPALQKNGMTDQAPALASGMPPQRKRPTVVDGAFIEPEWNREPTTHGSFNSDTVNRIVKAQLEEASRASSEKSGSSRSSLHRSNAKRASNSTTSSVQTPGPQKYKSRRYYQNNLTDEDRQALTVSELNHNLREWTNADLANYHASRPELIPSDEQREGRIQVFLNERRRSERMVFKVAHQSKQIVGSPLVRLEVVDEDEDETYEVQARNAASRPSNPRVSSTPNLSLTPTSPSAESSQSSFRFPDSQSSSGRRPGLRPGDRYSFVSSSTSVDTQDFVARPDATFDSFLAPHKSGKGEAHKDSDQARKPGDPVKPSRRLSMPQLKKRVSQTFSFKSKKK